MENLAIPLPLDLTGRVGVADACRIAIEIVSRGQSVRGQGRLWPLRSHLDTLGPGPGPGHGLSDSLGDQRVSSGQIGLGLSDCEGWLESSHWRKAEETQGSSSLVVSTAMIRPVRESWICSTWGPVEPDVCGSKGNWWWGLASLGL